MGSMRACNGFLRSWNNNNPTCKLAKGYAIISNGGYEIRPTLIKTEKSNKKSRQKRRILKEGMFSKNINPYFKKNCN